MEIIVKDGFQYRIVYNVMHKRNDLRLMGTQHTLSPHLRIPECVDGMLVTSVNEYAFNSNKELQTLEFPDSLEYFEDRCFSGCTNLKKVCSYATNHTSPELILFHQVFAKCIGLKTFQSNAPVSVFYEAFSGCKNLENILAVVKGMGTRAFYLSPTKDLTFDNEALWCKDSFDGLNELKNIRFNGTVSKNTCKSYLKDVKKKRFTLYVKKNQFNYLDWIYDGVHIIVE